MSDSGSKIALIVSPFLAVFGVLGYFIFSDQEEKEPPQIPVNKGVFVFDLDKTGLKRFIRIIRSKKYQNYKIKYFVNAYLLNCFIENPIYFQLLIKSEKIEIKNGGEYDDDEYINKQLIKIKKIIENMTFEEFNSKVWLIPIIIQKIEKQQLLTRQFVSQLQKIIDKLRK